MKRVEKLCNLGGVAGSCPWYTPIYSATPSQTLMLAITALLWPEVGNLRRFGILSGGVRALFDVQELFK